MTSVFIITEGDYSDKHIVKVCTTKPIADRLIEAIKLEDQREWGVKPNEHTDFDIYEYEVVDGTDSTKFCRYGEVSK